MISHAPADYVCPFYDDVVVKMNPKWWRNNKGALLVVPKQHHENVYDLPVELGTPIQRAVRDAAVSLKAAFDCDGDGLYGSRDTYWPDADEMRAYADKVRATWPGVS